jgi:hypothetical protein
MLTKPDTRLDDDLFSELVDQASTHTLSTRLTQHGVHSRSGAAVFSALLPEDFNYSQGDVQIIDGVLVTGHIKDIHVGTSSNSITQELWKQYGAQIAANFVTNGSQVINRWLNQL